MRHIMFDLETFGTAPGSVLRSIGAVAFDPKGEGHGAEFYANIDRASCEKVGLTVDAATEKWWAGQSREAEQQLLANPISIGDAVDEFHRFFRAQGGEYVWCQGANFDSVLWEAAAKATGVKMMPWKFWNVRDTRTAYHIAEFNEKSVSRAGTYHNALDDAKHQVVCVQTAIRKLRGVRPAAPVGQPEDIFS